MTQKAHDFHGRIALNIFARGREIGKELAKFRPLEEKAPTTPLEVVQVYPTKHEVSLLVGR